MEWNALTSQLPVTYNSTYTYNILNLANFPESSQSRLFSADLEHQGFILAASLKDNFEGQKSLFSFDWPRNGYYLVLLENVQGKDEITQWLREMWLRIGSVTVLTIFNGRLWSFQPFQKENGFYGRIAVIDSKDIGHNYNLQVTRDLNGYPFHVALFESGFYVKMKVRSGGGGANSEDLTEMFIGPDKEGVNILQNKMNFTGNISVLFIQLISEVKYISSSQSNGIPRT